jgi:hypothetical protein
MLNKKEIVAVLILTLIISFSISLLRSFNLFLISSLLILLVMLINITAKKIFAYYVESEIEVKIWEINRYGFKAHKHLKKPFPAGAFFPLITTAISAGYITWLAPLVFDVKAKVYRAAKRHGLYSFSEMTEYHIGLIAAAGIFANLLLSVIGYLLNFPTFAKLNIYFAFWNMIPLSDLDGNKVFFGSLVLWTFLAALVVIAMGYAIFLP